MALTPEDEGDLRDVTLQVVPPSAERGVVSWFEPGSVLRLETDVEPEPVVVVSGNAEGLRSLARQLLTLAQADTPHGSHMDHDTYGGVLEPGSLALRLELD
jgi:hypothetical protein